ncbi:substrate-binding domain-containing protein [Desulforhopalus singaporensis]|uniref:Tungstate transport system substrate-binding protein n=1 Tax=Desulforhopalus singaporensis TaxID=91360 RepID=A0A1H0LF92_9BACT|nr:substrate-binding domain-containing protein [Desulforhopalus singaporensis]SDO66753.1 tungstate transport system substrate-binding protein [Desulforhopalus singaporensis]
MLRKISVLTTLAVFLLFAGQNAVAEDKVLKMSTTTSTQASGLLDLLLPEFKNDTGIDVKVIAKGTGAAIRDGVDGNVDVIFVHAKSREEKFVADGYGTKRYPVMHNDFVIIGPAADPVGIKGMSDAGKALAKIAGQGAVFVSRGDDSGTHTKEQFLWKQSGVELVEKSQTIMKKGKQTEVKYLAPAGSEAWYMSIGQGMGKTITFAEEKQGYTMSDRGTYIKFKYGKTPAVELEVLTEGGDDLANPYGIIPVNPAKHPYVKNDLAMEFVTWITSEKGQKMIGDYRLEGKQLFYPDAK